MEMTTGDSQMSCDTDTANRCRLLPDSCTCGNQKHGMSQISNRSLNDCQLESSQRSSDRMLSRKEMTIVMTRTISTFDRANYEYSKLFSWRRAQKLNFSILFIFAMLLIVQLIPPGCGMGLESSSSGIGGRGGGTEVNSLTSNDHYIHTSSSDRHHSSDQDADDHDDLDNTHHFTGNHVREPIISLQHDDQHSNAITRSHPNSHNSNHQPLQPNSPQQLHNNQLLNLTLMLQELEQGCSSYCTDQIQSICINKGCRNWKTGLREGCSYVCNESENNFREFYACQVGCSKAIEEYYFRVTGLIGVPDPPTLISDSLKSSSLRLSWEGSALPLPYLVFTVQRRVIPRTSQWETIPSSSQQPLNTTTFTVQTLKPYTEYQFRIGFILAHDFPPYFSRESNPIETLPKGLPNPPEITSIQPISNTSVSVTWLPPSNPNGRLIAYILKLRKLPDGHIIIKEIPISQNPRGYTFTGLQPITNYSLEISAQNVEGEGETANVNFVTPQSSITNDITEKPEPKLLLQGIRDVYIQHLDLLLDPDVFVYNSSQNISAIASHFKYKWVFIATGEGDIIRTGLDRSQNLLIVPKDRLDLVVSFLAVDWLNNQLYIVGKKTRSSNWSIKRCDLNGNNLITIYSYLFEEPIDFAADPFTGYLYWVSPSSQLSRGGLYKLDFISDEFVNGPYPISVIEEQDLGPFVVDSVNYRILVVHKRRNTVLAVSLDGDVTDIRLNTQSPQFEDAISISWYNGIFYWTTGQSIVIEEYNAAQDSYYQNHYDVAKVHQPCSRITIVHPDIQPTPLPMAPPQRVQVIYGQTRARVSWRPPPVISGLGEGSWRQWRYQVRIVDNNVSFVNITDNEFIIQDLRASTFYSVQVAATSDSGSGPWSPPLRGKSLRETQHDIKFLWGSQSGLYTTNTLGENVELLASPSEWLNGTTMPVPSNEKAKPPTRSNVYMSSLTWFDNIVFFALSNGSVYYYDTVRNYPSNVAPKRNEITRLTGIPNAQSIAFDYIGQKLYWSNPKQQTILRCSFIAGSAGVRNSAAVNVETANPCSVREKAERLQVVTMARELCVDSYKGMLLWSTGHSLELSRLNGYSHRTLYQTGLFSGIHIMGITLDTDQSRIYWITRSSTGSTLQRLSYNVRGAQLPMIIAYYDDTSITGPIRYFNDRLIWLQGPSEAVITDIFGQGKSSLSISTINNITNLHVKDQSSQRYPGGLSRSKIQVYPDPILKWTIALQGKWNNFTISWTQVNNTNYGKILYEVVVNNSISRITPNANITIENGSLFRPYTDLEITVTSFTYWAASKPISTRLKTPSSRPSEPLNPRVFVKKLGYPYVTPICMTTNLSTGSTSVSVELRWDTPESSNGPILGYLIHCWKDTMKKTDCMCEVDMTRLQHPTCEIQHLAPASQYYFAIQAYTDFGAGNLSSKVLADTSFNTPVPRLMLVSTDQLQILDIDRNHLEAIPLGYLSPMTATHFAAEDAVFWFNEGQDLMWSRVGSVNKTRMLSLSGKAEASNLVVDWIGRKLYWAFEDTSTTASTSEEKYGIMSFDLVPAWNSPQTPEIVISSKTPIRSVTVNPFRRSLYWTTSKRNGITTLFTSETDGNFSRQFLTRDPDTCNCSSLSATGEPIAYDPHGLGRGSDFPSGILFVDRQAIWLSDENGCNCVHLVNLSTLPVLQSTPYRIAADQHRVYWAGGFLYASEKMGNGGATELQPSGAGVREVSIFGPVSQPYPNLNCLIPQQMDPREPLLFNHSSHSLHLQLPKPVTMNCSLSEVSLPTPKYNVYYGTVNENGISECTPTSSSFCKVITTLENMLHITDLHPYTTYTVFVTVTNYYAEQHHEKPMGCSPIMLRTAPGAPMPPTLLRLEPLTPLSIRVVWRQPEKLNGEKVWYEVHWKTQGTRYSPTDRESGQKWAETETRSNHNRTEYYLDLANLIPDSNYTIWVVAYSEKGDAFSESELKSMTTFSHPNNITLKKASPHNLSIFWVPPNDTSILRHQIMFRDGWSSQWNLTQLVDFTIPERVYKLNITNLKPKTLYGFRIQTWYIGDPKTPFIWPWEGQFNFETLADKPGQPGTPVARGIGRSLYEIAWEKADENGAEIAMYSLECKIDVDTDGLDASNQSLTDFLRNTTTPGNSHVTPRQKRSDKVEKAAAEKLTSPDDDFSPVYFHWVTIYNGTDARWQMEGLDINKLYSFRVRAKNVYGWGEYSQEIKSISFIRLILVPQDSQGFGIVLGSIFLACLTLGTFAFLTVFLYRGKLKEKPILNGTLSSSERREVELATLRELPGGSSFIHQSNILYAGDLLIDMDFAGIAKIHRHQISFTKFLGSGAFGEVYEGIAAGLLSPHEDTRVAIKTLRKGASNIEKMEFIQEAKLMMQFQHPHIIQLMGICVDTDPCCLLLELMSGGDLLSYLRSHRPNLGSTTSINILDLIKMCVDVAKGCVYLEEMHFVHRDLAARNCLVQIEPGDEDTGNECMRVVKIGDFGLARDIYRNDYYRKEGEGLLPVRWMAPESLVDGVFTTQSDMWAFGVLLWEIMTLGQQPYPARNNLEVLHYVRGGGRLHQPLHCPPSLSQLMLRCWEYNPDNRPSFRDCQADLENILQTYESILSSDHTQMSDDGIQAISATEEIEEDEYGFRTATIGSRHNYNCRKESAPKYIEVIAESAGCSEPLSLLQATNEGYEIPLPKKPPRKRLTNDIQPLAMTHSHAEYGLPSSPKYWNLECSQNFKRSNSASSNIPLLHKNCSVTVESRNQAFVQDLFDDVQYTTLDTPAYHQPGANSSPHISSINHCNVADDIRSTDCETDRNDEPVYSYSLHTPKPETFPDHMDYHRVTSALNPACFNRKTIDMCGSG